MNRFRFDKLVRDRIADKIRAEGHMVESRKLEGEELNKVLFRKIEEEIGELKEAIGSGERGEVVKELADVTTVVEGLAKALGVSKGELEAAMTKKTEKAGAFEEGVYIDAVELSPKGESYEYWLKSFRDAPERYPEE